MVTFNSKLTKDSIDVGFCHKNVSYCAWLIFCPHCMLTKEVQILDAISNLILEKKTSEDQELMTSMAEKGNNKNKTCISLDMEEVEVMSSTWRSNPRLYD